MLILEGHKIDSEPLKNALEIATARRKNETFENLGEVVEGNIDLIQNTHFAFEIFRTKNTYKTYIGDQRFIYYDAVVIKIITKGNKI